MALKGLGTNANNSLKAMKAGPGGTGTGVHNTVNVAILNNHIADDIVNGYPIVPGAFFGLGGGGLTGNGTPTFDGCGTLVIPNRGVLKVLYGDIVAYDTVTGWPILVSANALTNGPWHFA